MIADRSAPAPQRDDAIDRERQQHHDRRQGDRHHGRCLHHGFTAYPTQSRTPPSPVMNVSGPATGAMTFRRAILFPIRRQKS
jgi:hypothetical protein